MTSSGPLTLGTIEELRQARMADGAIIIVTGMGAKTPVGHYRWMPGSDLPEDTTNYTVVGSTREGAEGRWVRVFSWIKQLPQGELHFSMGKLTLYVDAVTDTQGKVSVNLTEDNTANGPAIFTKILMAHCDLREPIPSAVNDIPSGEKISQTAKRVIFQFRVGNTAVVVLGLNVLTFKSAAAGQNVTIQVEGK